MKTFKLISLQIVTEKKDHVDIKLTDGLIINKEDDSNTWIIEAFVSNSCFSTFEGFVATGKEVNVQAVITKKENDPAAFKTVVNTLKKVDGHVILLLEGHLQKTRSKYAELLLEDLVQQGMDGSSLIEQFKDKMRSRPKLVTSNKK
ncbi:hypothetical protein ELQ35_03755 [Peribacillus cavernae]|uniref:YwpF-like family protein n=1 Tax=Peribacillus cavernae TaxID=1674310 RepID=A0A433HT09_9BACI|nr:YwpF family protein [Peribacillus cavernae]MDQ0218477.1 hypothetical protein [Peribacillus cavernae]RUQ31473.1 hypothetical protein ELQ35_03755 [Peribacillus cavernae]